MMRSVLIANRGEIAVRVIRACRSKNLRSIAVFCDEDKDSLHVKMADEAYGLGEESVECTYLNIPKLLEIVERSKADAVHPGYGFLSENAEFAREVIKIGKIFIGPSPNILDFLGNKVQAKKLAEKVGLPVLPGSDGFVNTFEEAKSVADKIGYPIIIKAAFGGGGRGMEIVGSEEDLKIALEGCQSIALKFFGRAEVLIEKSVNAPRHVEIQFIGDNFGNVVHLGDRECTIQRSHQKLIEEAPSFLPRDLINRLGEKTCLLARELNYSNVGTAEFLWKNDKIYFNEVNPRIQVEHVVTEMVTGFDLVEEQLNVASNKPLAFTQEDISLNGHAIEYRINAEDPNNSFLPQIGRITRLIVPGGPRVRFDSQLYPNYVIPHNFDSLIGKLVVWGRNRRRAINLSKHALKELAISGINTNLDLHKVIIETKEFKKGDLSTDFLIRTNITNNLKDFERKKLAAVFQLVKQFKLSIQPDKIFSKQSNKWRDYAKIEQVR
ncbi:MAG: ATP-grasp domain-containing protein [Promethearchaeota archaeon]|nr:MAG: ATP-grasp domain-containing protein [Candidatus Lokiarchaeota archaeon]